MSLIKKFFSETQLRLFYIDGTEYYVDDELSKIARYFEENDVLLVCNYSGSLFALKSDKPIFLEDHSPKNISREEYLNTYQPEIIKQTSVGSILKISQDCKNVFEGKSKNVELLHPENEDELYKKVAYRGGKPKKKSNSSKNKHNSM